MGQAQAILSGADFWQNAALSKHADWVDQLQAQYTFTAEDAMDILRKETGKVFAAVLEELIGQAGSNAGWNPWEDPMEEYRQEVDKMQNAWKQTTGTMSAMFGIPVMLMGIALITLGTVMVIKGKKIAAKAET